MQVLRDRRSEEDQVKNQYADVEWVLWIPVICRVSAIDDYDRFCEEYYKSQSLAP